MALVEGNDGSDRAGGEQIVVVSQVASVEEFISAFSSP